MQISANEQRGGINLTLSEAPSPTWSVAGWQLQFHRLVPGGSLKFGEEHTQAYVKVITGNLARPTRGAYAEPFSVRSTAVHDRIEAGPDGALIAVFEETQNAPATLTDMKQIQFSGDLAEQLTFDRFHDKFSHVTDFFRDADAYMTNGIHLLDEAGEEIVNVIFWTAGKGVSLSTHNHGHTPSPLNPAFAEVHWVMRNGTGRGGMYLCESADSEPKQRFPMVTGEEHGPFFHLTEDGSAPVLCDNGAVSYPWHGWQGGEDNQPGQAYDLVCAFEITVPFARL